MIARYLALACAILAVSCYDPSTTPRAPLEPTPTIAAAPQPTPTPSEPSEYQRTRDIESALNNLTPENMARLYDAETLAFFRAQMAEAHPAASDDAIETLLFQAMRNRYRGTLEFFDACKYGFNSLIGEPSIQPALVEKALSHFRQRYKLEWCVYLNRPT